MTKKKYVIYREDNNECRAGRTAWTAQDLLDDYARRSDRYEDIIASFDDPDDARVAFEDEKKTCSSYYTAGLHGRLVLYDWISLAVTEEDDDGETVWSDYLDEYVAPVPVTRYDVVDVTTGSVLASYDTLDQAVFDVEDRRDADLDNDDYDEDRYKITDNHGQDVPSWDW